MKETEEKDLIFHSEDAVSRLVMWANIIAYVILAFALIGFLYDGYSIVSNWSQVLASLPSNPIERTAIFISKVFMNPMVGVFYFLVLRGLAQLLNIGRDLYYQSAEEAEEETPAA